MAQRKDSIEAHLEQVPCSPRGTLRTYAIAHTLPHVQEVPRQPPAPSDYRKLLQRVPLGYAIVPFYWPNEFWQSYWLIPDGGSRAIH